MLLKFKTVLTMGILSKIINADISTGFSKLNRLLKTDKDTLFNTSYSEYRLLPTF